MAVVKIRKVKATLAKSTAYVTDPATKKLIAVSLSNPAAPKELMSVELPKTPNEILGVSSSKPAPVEAEAHEGHSH